MDQQYSKGSKMDIKKIDNYASQGPQKTQEKSLRSVEEERRSPEKEASTQMDSVKLSQSYMEMAHVKKVMMQRGELRMERVDTLRNMIENGEYKVAPEKIAQKMLEELCE